MTFASSREAMASRRMSCKRRRIGSLSALHSRSSQITVSITGAIIGGVASAAMAYWLAGLVL
jgi:hypothetical protein